MSSDKTVEDTMRDEATVSMGGSSTTETQAPPSVRGASPMDTLSRNNAVLPPVGGDPIASALSQAGLRYREMGLLGSGAMGDVTLAQDADIGRTVALKKLHRDDEVSVQRLTREVRALGSLEHPGIVPIHDVGVGEDGRLFFVMKHLEGKTLTHVIGRLKARDPETEAQMTLQERYRICQALLAVVGFAHERGIRHRDIKPDNIMIGEHGEVVLVDWGLATDRSAPESVVAEPRSDEEPAPPDGAQDGYVTREGALLGTPRYMAPEQATGEMAQMDDRSDLYSLAVVFYELFTLQHPLGETGPVMETLMAVVQKKPTMAYIHVDPVHGRVASELAYFLDKGLHKTPNERFQSAEEMARELQDVQSGRFCVVCPATFVRKALYGGLNQTSRKPLLFVPLMLALTAFSAFTIVYFFAQVL